MNRRAFLVALGLVPVVAKAQVEAAAHGVYWERGPIVWTPKGPTVVTFPAGARRKQATLDPDGSIILCCQVGDRFFTMRQDAKGVYR